MEYIKVSRVIARVRNSLVARCPRQAEMILAASVRGRCPRKCVQAQKRLSRIWTAWAGGVFEFHTLIHSFHNSMCNFSERFVVDCRHVPLGRGGTGRALVCALRARAALILLFWSCTGGHCRRRRGWRASLFFKVCDNYCDISHCDCQLLCGTSVHIFQSGSKMNEKIFIKRIKIKEKGKVWLGKAFENKLSVTCAPLLAQMAEAGRRTQAGRVLQSTGWRCDLLPVPARLPVLWSTLSPTEQPVSQSSAQGVSCRLLPIQPCQKGGLHSRAKRTGASQSEGSPPQGADERVLLSKFTISSCALMLWDKAVTLQYKTTWKHSATALSFPCWNSAAANNTGTGTTWLLFQLLWAYTNQMPNQPMDKIAQNVPSGIEAIVNKFQNIQLHFLQPELLVRGKGKGGGKKNTNHPKWTRWYLLLRIISVICMLCYHSISNVANKGRSSRRLTFKHISWAGPNLCFNKPWTLLQLQQIPSQLQPLL